MRMMNQRAPFPVELESVVANLEFMPGWTFELKEVAWHAGSQGLALVITLETVNSYDPDKPYTVTHPIPVPPRSHDKHNWSRWVLEQILLVQRHEAMESFVVDGERPFPPGHGGGHDPYYPLTIY